MELSIESPCQHVTWKVRDFSQLPSDIGYSVDSPEFHFVGDSYCLRLFPNGDRMIRDGIKTKTQIKLDRLTYTFLERNVSYKIGSLYKNAKGDECGTYKSTPSNKLWYSRSYLEQNRRGRVPSDTLTTLCCMWLRKQSCAGSVKSEEDKTSDEEEEQEVLPGQSVFSSCWKSSKMELSIQSPLQNVTWKIPDFLQLSSEIGYSIDSPEFRFVGDSYCLRLYPNGFRNDDTRNIGLEVVRLTSAFPERRASCKCGYRWRNTNDTEFDEYNCTGSLTGEFRFWFTKSCLENNKDRYFRDGKFCVSCSLCLEESSGSGRPQNEETQTSDTEEEQERLTSMSKLQSQYRQLLRKGDQSDAVIVVCKKEFQVHRCVLRARSPVFEAMFGHETAEKESGRVVVDDLDPESFGEFLEYLYTGAVAVGISYDNAFGLYAAADKYDVPTLKSLCVAHMRRNLSVDYFCDVMALALRHSEEDLLQRAIEFFKANLPCIIVTVKWQKFLADNSTSANELFIKALVPGGQ